MGKSTIRICMGSSCFSRGNRENLELIEAFLKSRNLDHHVELAGSLCENNCPEGPIFWIDEVQYTRVDPEQLQDLLQRILVDTGKSGQEA